MLMYDRRRTLLVKVKRMRNRLYAVSLTPAVPVYLLTKAGNMAWRWHACLGHLHFRAMYKLGAKQMADGMPKIERIE